jgi:hypothetical protein
LPTEYQNLLATRPGPFIAIYILSAGAPGYRLINQVLVIAAGRLTGRNTTFIFNCPVVAGNDTVAIATITPGRLNLAQATLPVLSYFGVCRYTKAISFQAFDSKSVLLYRL